MHFSDAFEKNAFDMFLCVFICYIIMRKFDQYSDALLNSLNCICSKISQLNVCTQIIKFKIR